MEALREQRVYETYIVLLKGIYKECTGTITLHKKSGKFPIKKGFREKDTIQPKLFTACPDEVISKLDANKWRIFEPLEICG